MFEFGSFCVIFTYNIAHSTKEQYVSYSDANFEVFCRTLHTLG